MSPSARIAAQENGIVLSNDTTSFSDLHHARCVAAAKRAVREMAQAPEAAGISPGVMHMAIQSVWGHASLVQRLRLSLPDAFLYVRGMDGEWQEADNWERLQSVILPRIWNYGLGHKVVSAIPRFPQLLRQVVRWAAWIKKAQHKNKPWIVSPARKLKNGLIETLSRHGAGIAVLKPSTSKWGDYLDALRNLRAKSNVCTFPIAPLSSRDKEVVAELGRLCALEHAISDQRLRAAWRLYQQYLADIVPTMLAVADEGASIMKTLAPRAAVSYEANSWLSAAVLDGSSRHAKIKRIVFNHNSQPPSASTVANEILETLFRQRTSNGLVNEAFFWSPASAERLRAPHGLSDSIAEKGLRLPYPAFNIRRSGSRPLRVLHAGNYQNWSDFFPWIAETSDEYLNGLETLAKTVDLLDNIELTIRVRPKREVDAEAVENRLGHYRHVTICGTDQDFLEQLADHDLLMAHFSTTVEQALQMGKPVLLWGSTQRYEQFSAQSVPPAGALQDHVYTARTVDELKTMLQAIERSEDSEQRMAKSIARSNFDAAHPTLEALVEKLVH
ncbi:hypothetical protein [Herbaspirillum sp. NPDC101396]|uniref:hypothetical protein n=1 Tax=Herbaspirillum sp. NPDC101396 TaxID=3364005 RepID=UPI00383B0A78